MLFARYTKSPKRKFYGVFTDMEILERKIWKGVERLQIMLP